jgi:hypothetical protein
MASLIHIYLISLREGLNWSLMRSSLGIESSYFSSSCALSLFMFQLGLIFKIYLLDGKRKSS